MARHRNIKNIDIAEEREEFDDYGHSVEEEMCLSPGTAQYMYRGSGQSKNIGRFEFVPPDEDIAEEEEEADAPTCEKKEAIDDVNLDRANECLDTVRSVMGDLDEHDLSDVHRLSKKFDYNPELVINALIDVNRSIDLNERKPSLAAFNQKLTKIPPNRSEPNFTQLLKAGKSDNISSSISPLVVRSKKVEKVTAGFEITPDKGSIDSLSKRLEKEVNLAAATSSSAFPKTPKPIEIRHVSTPASATKSRLKVKPTGGKELINLVVIGHVDAGKSTLMGHLLFLLGNVNQRQMHRYKQDSQKLGKASFAFAWVLDETSEERERGITIDIAQARFSTSNRNVNLLDAPGHKDLTSIPNMISGAAQADCALLVINATRGEFETGFDFGGQTREHAMLIRSLGVSQLAVAVNKMDTVGWAKERFEEVQVKLRTFLKQTGYPDPIFVPCSGINGENLVEPVPDGHPLKQWYKGPTLLQVIDEFQPPSRSVEKPLRLIISDVFRGQGSGLNVAGLIETGAMQVGDRVIILPNGDSAQIKSIQTDEATDVQEAFAGEQTILTLVGADLTNVSQGHIVCHPESPCPIVTKFEAKLVVFNIQVPITPGYGVSLHTQCLCEPAVIVRLISQVNKSTGEVLKKKPRCLTKNSSGVVEISVERPICLERYQDCKELGRITLRAAGQTIAAGMVTKA